MEIPISIKQIAAFTKRDFFNWSTYKTSVATQIINIFIGVFSWGVRAAYVQRPVQEMYGTDYISFLVVGIAISNLLMPLVTGVQRQLNPWTLETVLMTGISTPVFVIGNVMWRYIFSVFTFIPYIIIGVTFFGVNLNINPATTITAFIISACILMGLAMISTGIRIVTKSTDPVTWAIGILENLFAGMSFPVEYLDTIFFTGVSAISWFLPHTWVYHLCRLGMLKGAEASLLNPNIQTQFLTGSIFAITLLPIGFKIFQWGVKRAKKEGTLGHY